jgi:hypothetical protein
MKASAVDMRTKTSEIFRALDRNEEVALYCRGKLKGIIQPVLPNGKPNGKQAPMRVEDCAFFGMWADREDMKDPTAWVRELRKPRFTFHPVPKRRKSCSSTRT